MKQILKAFFLLAFVTGTLSACTLTSSERAAQDEYRKAQKECGNRKEPLAQCMRAKGWLAKAGFQLNFW